MALPPPPPCPLQVHCASELNLPAWTERWVNENTNRIEAAFKYRLLMYTTWNKYDAESDQLFTTDDESDGPKLEKIAGDRLVAFAGYCDALDRDLRGVTKKFDALPKILGRGCTYLKTPGDISGWGMLVPSTGLNLCTDLECIETVHEDYDYYEVASKRLHIEKVKPIIKKIALDFYLSTGKRIVVTSGSRTFDEQATQWIKKYYPLTKSKEKNLRSTYSAVDAATIDTIVNLLKQMTDNSLPANDADLFWQARSKILTTRESRFRDTLTEWRLTSESLDWSTKTTSLRHARAVGSLSY
jgi:hypothetical protein